LTLPNGEHYNFIELLLHPRDQSGARKESVNVKLDKRMKRLLREMGEAINDSLSASEELTATIERIRKEGFDIFLILEATIGLNPKSGNEDDQSTSRLPAASIEISEATPDAATVISKDDGGSEMVFQVSPDDEQFLRSLRISVEDSSAQSGDRGPADEEDTDTPGLDNDEDGDDA
jgi:hypothetical protein